MHLVLLFGVVLVLWICCLPLHMRIIGHTCKGGLKFFLRWLIVTSKNYMTADDLFNVLPIEFEVDTFTMCNLICDDMT